ncbi:MAG TPA: rhamnulokinase [Candidatus Blautia stercoravium]|nr:rhamnulokinase [Candidatus Blautia stercoravium]
MEEQKKRVLAIDFGASGGRAMIAELEGEYITIQEIHRFPNEPVYVGKTFYWDILRLFHEIKRSLQKAKSYGSIDSVSVDTWGVDFGILDKDGNLLANPVHYRDKRTEGMCSRMEELFPPQKLYELTGNQIMEINTVFQLLALKEKQPEYIREGTSMLMMPDLFHYMLTGKKVAEISIASTSQMLHIQNRSWANEISELLEFPQGFLPEIVESGTIVGGLTGEICEELEIPPIKVIASAGHDTQCAMVAAPASEKDFIFLSCGTWSLFGTELDQPVVDESSQYLNVTNECGYGGKISFLKNIIGLWLIQESRRQWAKEGKEFEFSQLEKLGKEAEPFRSLIDPDDPIFTPSGNIPRRICEYCRNTGQPVPETTGQIVRCINESLALKYRNSLEEISQCTGKDYEVIYMVGGGTQSKELCQMTADASGRRVSAGPVEATALGNAMIQMMAAGAVENLEKARSIIRNSQDIKVYEPQEEKRENWERAYRFFMHYILKK